MTSCGTSDEPMAVAKTWVGVDQLHDDQQQHADAWARLIQAEMVGT